MSFYTKGGNVKVVSLKVNRLGSVWNQDSNSATKIMMDTNDRELSKGQSDKLLAMVENGTGSRAQPLKWNSSNKDVVELNVMDNSQATIVGKKKASLSLLSLPQMGRLQQAY